MNRGYIYIFIFIFFFSCDSMNRENLIANAIKTNSRSVVGIHVTMIENNGRVSKGFGSGVSIDKEGYIVTNAHVVEFADTITVITVGGKEFIAKIIGTDRLSDIALIKIESKNTNPHCIFFKKSRAKYLFNLLIIRIYIGIL